MKNKYQFNLSLNHQSALGLSLISSFLVSIFSFIGFIFNDNNYYFDYAAITNAIVQFFNTFLVMFLLYEFCFLVFRKKWGRSKMHWVALFGVISITLLISPVFSQIGRYVLQASDTDLLFQLLVVVYLIKDLVLSFIVYLSTLYIVTSIHSQQMLLENQQLQTENIRNRYEALKNQLNPHFLFNTLNTLDGLIGFDDEKAHSYLQNLSSSFRYTIQNKEITTLKEELNFVKSYTYLMKIRYGENLSIKYNIDEKYCDFLIMPVSLQLLMENALKHNIINDKHPLTICIETSENDTIKVSNTIQPKINTETGEGIGLANLVERYHLFFGKEVIITQNGVFGVEIPLIAPLNPPEVGKKREGVNETEKKVNKPASAKSPPSGDLGGSNF